MSGARNRWLVPAAFAAGLFFSAVASAAPGGGHSTAGLGGGHASAGYARGGGFAGRVRYGAYPRYGRGYYGRGYGPWYGWRGGIGLGFWLPVLPWYYTTLWYGGVPYYYADNTYYTWDDRVAEYQAVQPPSGSGQPAADPAGGGAESPAGAPGLFAYPRANQPAEQQARDRAECREWAAAQPAPEPAPATTAWQSRLRAEAACLEGRNYSVK